jgi:hypothetical protein
MAEEDDQNIADNISTCKKIGMSESKEDLKFLYATAIVNPYGPTTNIFYYKTTDSEYRTPLIQFLVHPISESAREVGTVYLNKRNVVSEIEFYNDFFDFSMPTLFLNSIDFPEELFKKTIGTYIESINDSDRTYLFIKKYEGNPVKRITAEIDNIIDKMSTQKIPSEISFLKKLFSKKKQDQFTLNTMDFIYLLRKEKNIISEIKALMIAYDGAIKNSIPEDLVKTDFNTFIRLLVEIFLKCGIDVEKIKFR